MTGTRRVRAHRHRRHIAVITGTRAEYGLFQSTMQAICAHRGHQLQLVATGMHLLRRFGYTVQDIINDGWKIDARVRMQRGDDDAQDQAEGLARGVRGIARFLREAKTDIVVVLGDRIEAMAGALAAVTTATILAHIHGGDVAPGDNDEGFRHAITKLAHVHLAATRAAARRIIRMGEQAHRVHVVGAPGLDQLLTIDKPLRKKNGAHPTQALVVQHPIGRSARDERRTMDRVLNVATREFDRVTVLYPNSDRGHSGIIDAIESYKVAHAGNGLRVARNMPRESFLHELIAANVLVGNSSCGIIEAGAAGTTAVNIGPRQDGRQRNGSYVLDAGEDEASIRNAVRRALALPPIKRRISAYGDGSAGRRIAAVLAEIPHDASLRRKKNSY